MESLIVTKNLTKIYKTKSARVNALNNANIEICKGEFVAIVGTSGSGKSTLLSLLAGLEKPTAGKIFIKGQAIHRMPENKLVDFRLKHVGFIFQSFNLFPEMTALENAAFSLNCKGISKMARHTVAKQALLDMGLKQHLTHKPEELSGGQQQRVAIVRAILSKPELVFADEPTGNLDTKTSTYVIELLRSLVKSEGSTLIMVTHDIEKAKYADRIIRIEDGVISEKDIS
jgi:putative ABC transport system ATP-binding protein